MPMAGLDLYGASFGVPGDYKGMVALKSLYLVGVSSHPLVWLSYNAEVALASCLGFFFLCVAGAGQRGSGDFNFHITTKSITFVLTIKNEVQLCQTPARNMTK